MDGGAFVTCNGGYPSTPASYTAPQPLADGEHWLTVRGTAGSWVVVRNVRFYVRTVFDPPPTISIVSGPEGTIDTRTASFDSPGSGSSPDPATMRTSSAG